MIIFQRSRAEGFSINLGIKNAMRIFFLCLFQSYRAAGCTSPCQHALHTSFAGSGNPAETFSHSAPGQSLFNVSTDEEKAEVLNNILPQSSLATSLFAPPRLTDCKTGSRGAKPFPM